jgi:hypothetical protein
MVSYYCLSKLLGLLYILFTLIFKRTFTYNIYDEKQLKYLK